MKLRLPDVTSLYLDGAKYDFYNGDCSCDEGYVKFKIKDGALLVYSTSFEKGARYVRLRWNEAMRKDIKVLGDAWERGYGDLNWGPVFNDRCMPWYMAVSNGSDSCLDYSGRYTECFGVGVQPNAMAFWQYDTCGITLWLDICSTKKELRLQLFFLFLRLPTRCARGICGCSRIRSNG